MATRDKICGPEMSLSGVCLKKPQRRLKRRTSGITVSALLTHSLLNSEPISLPWAHYRGGMGRQSSTCYFLCNSLWVLLPSSSLQPFPKATPPPSITGSRRRRRSPSPITALTFYSCARKTHNLPKMAFSFRSL